MRIRKRFPPPILTPPRPPPDPTPVQPLSLSHEEKLHHHHQHHHVEAESFIHPLCDLPQHDSLTQPKQAHSDPQLISVRATNGWICSKDNEEKQLNKKSMHHTSCTQDQDPKSQLGRIGEEASLGSAIYRRDGPNRNSFGAKACVGLSVSSSSSVQGGMWCNGDIVFPLKKRRGRCLERMEKETMHARVKSKTNKNWEHWKEHHQEERVYRLDLKTTIDKISKKKRKRVDVDSKMMEGSRCSRANGRGWRCCQQTLVGYSLCEHHLGKRRLRSITSVPSTSKNIEKLILPSPSPSPSSSLSLWTTPYVEEEEEEKDNDKPWMITKKKRKIGIVKARSIRSLLCETPTPHAPQVHNKC